MLTREISVLDSLLRAVRRRVAARASPFNANLSGRLIYLDLGLHRAAIQIRRMRTWFGDKLELAIYGFEANPEYFNDCRSAFAGDPRIHLVNAAVVGPDHQGDSVSLHIGGRLGGLGDSIYRKQGRHARMISVPALRLSEFLRSIDRRDAKVLLRMNIEGAELDVLRDLAENNMLDQIDGWFGLWNDAEKIDPRLGSELAAIKASARIENVSFNDRDSRGRYAWLKEAIIRYEIATHCLS